MTPPSTDRSDRILVLNAGSSSIKFSLFESGEDALALEVRGEVERIGGDLGKLAKAYGARALVVTSVTARAESLHLNVQLVDAGTRRLLWSQEYDGDRQGFLALARAATEGL